MVTLALRSRRVLLPPGRLAPATITLSQGRITEIVPELLDSAVDLGDDVLMPALTDTHVHLDEPGRTEWEGFATGTRAAAAGGVTLLVDMPLNSLPVTTTAQALQAKLDAARGQLHVDCGFWGGVIPGNTGELRPMVEGGVLGFKAFLCPSGIDEFPQAREPDLLEAMPVLRDCGVPLLVHAELEAELRELSELPGLSGLSAADYRRYLHSRPKEWEDRAVELVIQMVERTGCRAHIVHLSSSGALAALRGAKARGLPITAETCPHYLGLAAEEVPMGATEYKCAPPIRERDNQQALWQALSDGTLDFVVTDHSPCVPSLKRPETGDFLAAWGGIASLQLGLRSVWTGASQRGLSLPEVAGWMARAPARWLGLPRGELVVGAPADLVRFRPEARAHVRREELLHRHDVSPWVGRELLGEVASTWMRGELVWDEGQVVGPPRGRPFLRGQM
jgi:allantoinase